MTRGITTANLGVPDLKAALDQHEKYVLALRQCGVGVTVLPELDAFPDSVFVEDVALCTRSFAVVTRPGAASRLGEAALMKPTLSEFFEELCEIEPPGTLDAGDVMMVGDHFYIGNSARTNTAGAEQLSNFLRRHGMRSSVIALREVLHLKTGVAYLENGWMAVCGEFVNHPEFAKFKCIEIPSEEAYAANCIWINDRIIMPSGYHRACEKLAATGLEILECDMSEFRKLDGGVSCLSLRLESAHSVC